MGCAYEPSDGWALEDLDAFVRAEHEVLLCVRVVEHGRVADLNRVCEDALSSRSAEPFGGYAPLPGKGLGKAAAVNARNDCASRRENWKESFILHNLQNKNNKKEEKVKRRRERKRGVRLPSLP